MRMNSEESGMSDHCQISISVYCLSCNNFLIPQPISIQFSEKNMCKQHMDMYLQFYFWNTCNGMRKENPEKCTQDCCEATGIDG